MDSRAFCFPQSHPSRRLLEEAWFAEPGFAFQRAMHECGVSLGEVMFSRLAVVPTRVCVTAPAEDADGIARGVCEYLQSKGVEVRLLCLWSRVERIYEEGINVAPILRTFAEPGFDESEILVAVQSFVADGTILKTNITAAFQHFRPSKVHVLAPALYKDLQAELIPQFPAELAGAFEFHTFAYDNVLDRDTGELKPGIGGRGYERYGLPPGRPYLDFPLSVLEILQRTV